MAFHLVSSFLFRAPLLPVAALPRAGRALAGHVLGADAVALASPDLASALGRGKAAPALERYGRRAAFRATPHGLLAGVGVGRLGARTAIASGGPRAHLAPSWGRLAALGRALLEDPAVRQRARLRVAPSLLASHGAAVWLALGAGEDGAVGVREAFIDGPLAAVLESADEWTPWPTLRAAAGGAFADGDGAPPDEEEVDDYLLLLLDQGALAHDLAPPLVGPPPHAWMSERLAALAPANVQAALAEFARPTRREAALRALQELPGKAPGHPLQATLVHGGTAVLSRPAVARAAALAPLLFRLQEALAPPADERALNITVLERIDGVAELFGAGALEAAALGTGGYGVSVADVDEPPVEPASPAPSLLEHLTAALLEGNEVLELDAAALSALLPEREPPPSFELVVTPCRPRPGPPGAGWLLGLHAPAGASWGRFAHALGEPMAAALDELAAAERAARPGEPAADVSFAPSAALADLCVHPPVRERALALVGWSDDAVACQDLSLVLDPAADEPLRLRAGSLLRPSPLHRVRSTTVPGGLYRLLAGWSFVRQQVPWAFSWGALAHLPRLPRVVLDGFVVAPASWSIPPADALRGRGLARWRQALGVPRTVQVGEGDELLYLDLEAPGAAGELARQPGRAHEIRPPLDALPDRDGRRLEAVIAVVSSPPAFAADSDRAARAAGPVLPGQAAPGWTTHKLYGAEDRQDQALLGLVAPLVLEARAAGEIDQWYFLRYLEPPGRHHLRLRTHSSSEAAGELFSRRLRGALAGARAAGDVAALEAAEYFPESARYGGHATLDVVERIFELDSELVLRLLAAEEEAAEPPVGDRIDWLVRNFDALCRGLGLDLAARHRIAQRRRAAHLAWLVPHRAALDADFRRRQRRLGALLAGTAEDAFSAALDVHSTRVQATALAPESAPTPISTLLSVLPPILHLCAVRLLGPHPPDEAAAYLFWERTLEGLAARRRGA